MVTAGSCFAQHLARRLDAAGFRHHVTEPGHPILPPQIRARHNYGLFSARYGNVYTARQLLQLIRRALGRFAPRASAWPHPGGETLVDPFRPQIQPGGFVSVEELDADRARHLDRTRRALTEADVFVFTLGLTEAWEDSRDGAVFPLAPGVAGGRYDPDEVGFVNFGVEDTTADLLAALGLLREVNPAVRIVLTVSPVPLNATFADRHVAEATAWSKAVLRVAAETARARIPDCCYFPSYEIITSPQTRGRYFGADRRTVTEDGVDHVMALFFRHLAAAAPQAVARKHAAGDRQTEEIGRIVETICDEEAIDNRD